MTWDESKHPRHPAGSPEGGEFKSFSRAPAIRRVWDDNPGGPWEEHEQRAAEERRLKEKRLVSGSPTAGWRGRLPASAVASIPGLMNEGNLTSLTGDAKALAIRDSIAREGVKRPIFVNVNHRGEAYINEGNHRAALAAAAGQRTVPVQFAYFAGGEKVPGRWNIGTLKGKVAQVREYDLKRARGLTIPPKFKPKGKR